MSPALLFGRDSRAAETTFHPFSLKARLASPTRERCRPIARQVGVVQF